MWKRHGKMFNSDYGGKNGPDYTDKVVLDIGCAFHTPDFFLEKGAGHVIAIDTLEDRMEEIIRYAKKFGQVTPITTRIAHVHQLVDLYKKYHPDIVKLDCEGCEAILLRLKRDIFRIPEWYVMETHPRHHKRVRFFDNHNVFHLHGKIKEKLRVNDYKIVFSKQDRFNNMSDTGIIKAKRLNPSSS